MRLKNLSSVAEKTIEQYLIKRVKDLKGVAYKFTSPNRRGVPDRLCLFPHGLSVFVECKRPGGVLTALQDTEIKKLNSMGHRAVCVSTKEEIDDLIDEISEDISIRKIIRGKMENGDGQTDTTIE
jgi:hypothetical protein